MSRVGQNHIYIRCIHGIFGRKIIKCTVIYGGYIRFWPTLRMTPPQQEKKGMSIGEQEGGFLQDEVYLMNRPWTEAGAAGTLQYRRTELHTGRI